MVAPSRKLGALILRVFMPKRKSDGPVTIKEALKENVRQQQRRSNSTASPPEAQRSVRERVKSQSAKRKAR